MDFTVHPEQLRQHGSAIEDLGTGSVGELGALHDQTTEGATSAWGSDITAAMLGGFYQELASLTGEALDLLTSVMQHSGTEIRLMADRYQQTEDDNRGGFQQIQGGLA